MSYEWWEQDCTLPATGDTETRALTFGEIFNHYKDYFRSVGYAAWSRPNDKRAYVMTPYVHKPEPRSKPPKDPKYLITNKEPYIETEPVFQPIKINNSQEYFPSRYFFSRR